MQSLSLVIEHLRAHSSGIDRAAACDFLLRDPCTQLLSDKAVGVVFSGSAVFGVESIGRRSLVYTQAASIELCRASPKTWRSLVDCLLTFHVP